MDRETGTYSTAKVATQRPGRYGRQLVSHLTRRASGEWSDEEQSGSIDFADGRATISCAPEGLLLRVDAAPDAPADSLARLEDVVGRHLVRFGARDELVVRWVRADGTAGTEQHKQDD